MSQLRLYLDEDSMRKSLVSGLRARSVDTLTASEAEMINRADEDHLRAASADGRMLYSYNLEDFCILHKAWVSQGILHAGSSSRRSSGTRWAKNFDG